MAHLWVQDGSGAWSVMPLAERAVDLSVSPPRPDAGRRAEAAAGGATPVLVSPLSSEGGGWCLIARLGADIRINGLRPLGGMRLLQDGDEIRIDGRSLFFGAESLPRVETFAAVDQPKYCPRCRQELAGGCDAVRCPHCGIWHHQSAELPCWSYAETCALCSQPTDLDNASFSWSPEDL
jgi:hypothetical protein